MPSLIEQLHAFAVTLLGGVAMGVLFDVLRVVRGFAGRRGPLAWALDLLYWIVVTPLMAGLLLEANRGELRLYVFVGIAAGLGLYFAFLSAPVLGALLAVSRGVSALLAWAAHLGMIALTLPAMLLRSASWPGGAGRWRRVGREGGTRLAWRFPWRAGLAWRRR
ncbi:MAG: hypothetical protein BAA04_08790 [Firmicutes bacterium ZCTH02-B6]|nr:MAG: hypothetical protein BAA04_08790 [Firmicutes bacterium ZCTH02-B6]